MLVVGLAQEDGDRNPARFDDREATLDPVMFDREPW